MGQLELVKVVNVCNAKVEWRGEHNSGRGDFGENVKSNNDRAEQYLLCGRTLDYLSGMK